MAQISPLQMTDAKHWGGLTTANHFGSIFQSAPQKATKLITAIHNTNFGLNLDSYLEQFGVKYMETDADFIWELIGTAKRNIPLVEARVGGTAITGTSEPGANGSTFELVFPEQWFFDEDLIVGHKNELYPIKIIGSPYAEGSNWVYPCKFFTGDNQAFIDPAELAPGKRFSRDWAPVEQTLSKKGTDINFTSPFSLRNSFTMIRMQHTTPGNMKNRPFGTAFKTPEGKTFKVWTQYKDWRFEQEYREMKNRLLMFATSNRADNGEYTMKGKSGYYIKQGAGIRQQMESSNTHYYSEFTIPLINDILMDLSEGRLPSDRRRFLMNTGERGTTQFHEAIENYTQLYTPLRVDNRVYSASSAAPHSMGLGYGGQFVEYKAPNNIIVAVAANSLYDDRERNKEYHPNGGTVESYRYDILDVGTTEGENNIQKLYVQGSEDLMGYEPGLRDPYSPTGARSRIMSHPVDGYVEHRACTLGSMVIDPSKNASLILNMQA